MKFTIENIEEFSGGMAQIYSVMFEGDDMTLMDQKFRLTKKMNYLTLKPNRCAS